jgi:hypothetical protein
VESRDWLWGAPQGTAANIGRCEQLGQKRDRAAVSVTPRVITSTIIATVFVYNGLFLSATLVS